MTSKIFRNSFLVGVAVFFLSIALFMGVLYQYFGSQLLIQLESEAALAARGVEMGSMDYLDGLSSANRITWIDAGGTVLFDNQADPAQMENHADREEVRAALESETGTASRYSTTLSQRTLYFAQRLADGTVLRVSSEQRSLPSLLLSMVQPILIILVLAVACRRCWPPAFPSTSSSPSLPSTWSTQRTPTPTKSSPPCFPASSSRTRPSPSRWPSCARSRTSSPPSPRT